CVRAGVIYSWSLDYW
nr:immunoglobulin heavy chain junction region [Macaca mulatta]